ncbi:MAG: hydrogenase expression protein [Planctomycetes bacterium]|nr:hydrogenase expression protein [Planctomycetota bacterium]
MPLPVGKLPAATLARLLALCREDPRVLVRPGVGRDAAAVAFGGQVVIAKSDPITFATDRIGWYAVNVNANDVACLGATPRFFLATLLLPEGAATDELAEGIFRDVAASCEALDVTLCGGHTEVTYGLGRPIVVGHMLGEVPPDRLVRNDRCRAGDDVLLTKGIAIEGTALIAREKADELRADPALLDRAQGYLNAPGISVVRDAQAICGALLPHALHDPTEGGLATGLHELAEAAGLGIEVDFDAITVFPETQALCRHYGLDALGLIASGALLAVTAPGHTSKALAALAASGIPARTIGRMVPRERGVAIRREGRTKPLPRFDSDEVARLFCEDGPRPQQQGMIG